MHVSITTVTIKLKKTKHLWRGLLFFFESIGIFCLFKNILFTKIRNLHPKARRRASLPLSYGNLVFGSFSYSRLHPYKSYKTDAGAIRNWPMVVAGCCCHRGALACTPLGETFQHKQGWSFDWYENHICELRSEELNEGWSSQRNHC